MKLDRNLNPDGRGKYALLKLRGQEASMSPECQAATDLLKSSGWLDFGDSPEAEFFVIRLKDQYATAALVAYANQAMQDDPEYANEILVLALRAQDHPSKRRPD